MCCVNVCIHACRCPNSQKRVSDFLELEIKAAMSLPV